MDEKFLQDARRKAERAVADMADGELKAKAFEVILTRLLAGDGGAAGAAPAKSTLSAGTAAAAKPHTVGAIGAQNHSIDFSLPVRPFIKRYGSGMGGPQLFALLLAHTAQGDETKLIARADIEKLWNRMTELLGGHFNPSRTTRAKDNGWVETPKHGFYRLLPGWKEIFKDAQQNRARPAR